MTMVRRLRRSRAYCQVGLVALVSSAGLLWLGDANAQVATDGSLGAQTTLAGPNYQIDASLGQQRGANLFHSFGTFNVGTTESATFETPSGTSNIIARVTGGLPSQIDGVLMANANLFLLNPQGILVGANASINVTGSLHLSTADYVRLGSNSRFYANLSATSVLSTAPPTAFGFLDGAIAPVRVSGTTFNLSNERTLSIVGGEVSLEQASINAPGGRVNLAGAAGPGEVVFGEGGLDTTTLAARGDVRLSDVSINGQGVAGADVYIRAGQFVMENHSSIAGDATAGTGSRVVDIDSDFVTLRASRIEYGTSIPQGGGPSTSAAIHATGFAVSESSVLSIAGGGDLSIVANTVLVDSGSSVGTGTSAGGPAGSLSITAGLINVNAGTLTTIGRDSDAGGIRIDADTMGITNGGTVVSTTSGTGEGGAISINARELTIVGSQSTADTGISAGTSSIGPNAGNAGQINISAGAIRMRGGSVSSVTTGTGQGGDVRLSADLIEMNQGASVTTETGLIGNQGPSVFGNGGAIAIDADTMQMESGARISASTLANGQGGSISIDAAQLQMDSTGAALATSITANSGRADVAASGAGGNLNLNINDVQLRNQAQIASNAYGSGQAGRIEMSSNSISIASGGVISASSFGQAANAGSANDINIAAQQLNIDDFGQITNSTTGAGDAGRLSISADQIRIANGGLLQASSLRQSGQAGAVGDISIGGQSLMLDGGSIHARSFGAAAPGRIEINSGSIAMTNGAVIAATSAGSGDAGFIAIHAADSLRLSNSSRITTEALQGSGGSIQVRVGNRMVLVDSAISTSVLGAAANSGNILIDPLYAILNNSQIIARAVGGSGGNIDFSTQLLIRDANSSIDASSELGISGRVGISGLDVDLEADFAPLPTDFLTAQVWQDSPCAGPAARNASQFVVTGRDGAYRSPLDYIQSPLLLDSQVRTAPVASAGDSFAATLPSFNVLCLAR